MFQVFSDDGLKLETYSIDFKLFQQRTLKINHNTSLPTIRKLLKGNKTVLKFNEPPSGSNKESY